WRLPSEAPSMENGGAYEFRTTQGCTATGPGAARATGSDVRLSFSPPRFSDPRPHRFAERGWFLQSGHRCPAATEPSNGRTLAPAARATRAAGTPRRVAPRPHALHPRCKSRHVDPQNFSDQTPKRHSLAVP